MNYVERILTLMQEKNISAHKLEVDCELANASVQGWRNGRCKPSVLAVIRIAEYFDVSLDFLLKGENYKEKGEKNFMKNLTNIEGDNNTVENESPINITDVVKKETDLYNDNDKYSNDIYNRIELMCRFSGKTIENIIENTSIVEKDFENLKNGKAPSFLMLKALSDFFNCSINYLIFGELNHNNEYSNKINTIIKKYKISHEQFTSYSGVPYNILDLFGKGILPIGLLHWRVQNSIENLSGKQESFNFEVDYSKCNYFVCESFEAKNYIEMLKLPQDKQNKVWEFIETLKLPQEKQDKIWKFIKELE